MKTKTASSVSVSLLAAFIGGPLIPVATTSCAAPMGPAARSSVRQETRVQNRVEHRQDHRRGWR